MKSGLFWSVIVKNDSLMTLIVLIVNYVLGLVLRRIPRGMRASMDRGRDTVLLAPVAVLPVAVPVRTPPGLAPPNRSHRYSRYESPGRPD